MEPLVSVIVPCFNKAKYLNETIESIYNQTYNNIEIICVNDASTDDTAEILLSIKNKYENVTVFEFCENKGVVEARNYAINMANGEYILPLDADDTIEPTYIEKAVKVLNDNPNIGMVYSLAKKIGSERGLWKLPPFNSIAILYNNCIFCSALFRKSDFIKAGKYKSYMNIGPEDWDLWLSFLEIGLKPYRILEVLFNYRMEKHGTRSEETDTNDLIWKRQLIKNHIDLYLDDDNFIKQTFSKKNLYKLNKKLNKYRGIYRLSILLISIMLLVVVFLMFARVSITIQGI